MSSSKAIKNSPELAPASFDGPGVLSSIEVLLADLKEGRPVIVVDDESRENEGDLIIAADKITPEGINFMARYGRGLICLALEPAIIERLKLPPMTTNNTASFGTAFTVSIGAREGITTGISAADRARTVQAAVNPQAQPADLVSPGHVFPLKAKEQGVLERPGHTEAAVDLARLSGLSGAGVICEVMNEDGTMARLSDLQKFAARHNLKIGTIAALQKYRRDKEGSSS